MALIKKLRKSFFGGYKKKDVETFVVSVAEVTLKQQEIIGQKISDIEELSTQINDYEIEKITLEQQIEDHKEEQSALLKRIRELEAQNASLENEIVNIKFNYDTDISSLESQLEDLKSDLNKFQQKPRNEEIQSLDGNVSDILLSAEIIASEIIEDAKKINENMKTQSSNIIDINSVRTISEKEQVPKKSVSFNFDKDLELLESELVSIQNELNHKIEETIRDISSLAYTEDENYVMRSAGSE